MNVQAAKGPRGQRSSQSLQHEVTKEYCHSPMENTYARVLHSCYQLYLNRSYLFIWAKRDNKIEQSFLSKETMRQQCQVSNPPLLILKYNSPTATKQHKSGLQQKIN